MLLGVVFAVLILRHCWRYDLLSLGDDFTTGGILYPGGIIVTKDLYVDWRINDRRFAAA